MSREYPPDTGWGGIGAYTYQMAHALTDLGHEVEVVSLVADKNSNGSGMKNTSVPTNMPSSPHIKVHRAQWADELSQLRMFVTSMPFSHYTVKTAFAMWELFLKRHQERPFDVIEVAELLAGGIMPIASKVIPTVVKLHTPHLKFAAEQLHGVVLSFDTQLINMLERITMLMADEICSPSDDLAKFVADDLAMPLENIHIVRNPINVQQFSPEGEVASLAHKGPKILFAGRLEERKGINYLIEAVPEVVRECPDAHFVVVGADTPHGPGGSALAHCKQILQNNNCLSNVTFVSQVELAKMPSYYRAADICVVPSLYDNAPYTCIEAMSCGRPVICTTAGGTREYIDDGRTGLLVEPKNSQALATAIIRLLKNGEERQRIGAAAREYVVSTLSNEVIARQMVSLYQNAMEKHARREKARLYFREQEQLLPDAKELLRAYDQMLYDYSYQVSLKFRLQHWVRSAKQQPERFRNRVAIRLARPLAKRFPKSHLAHLVSKLENKLKFESNEKDSAHQF